MKSGKASSSSGDLEFHTPTLDLEDSDERHPLLHSNSTTPNRIHVSCSRLENNFVRVPPQRSTHSPTNFSFQVDELNGEDSLDYISNLHREKSSLTLMGITIEFQRVERRRLFLLLGTASLLLILTSLLFFLFFSWMLMVPPMRVKNVVFMISDGFGPAGQVLARDYIGRRDKSLMNMALDGILVGNSRTRSSSSWITDSAAGATAYACGLKTFNAAIGVDPETLPCGTILEAAHAKGMKTGIVVTSRITHATPASFATHVKHRDMENDIALQLAGNGVLGRTVDLLFGGGKCHFRPNTTLDSCRNDSTNVIEVARSNGFNIGDGLPSFEMSKTVPLKLPHLNLFADDHMAYNIDRNDHQPSLSDMARVALDTLQRESDNGFFLMIEGSRIDMAAHSNDPLTLIQEIIEYNKAVQAVLDFIDQHPETLLISTSDHETGGLSVGVQLNSSYPVYEWTPIALEGMIHSGEYIADKIFTLPDIIEKKSYIMNIVFRDWLGMEDEKDLHILDIEYMANANRTAQEIDQRIGKIMSDKALIGWSTHGHSAVDVNLYSSGGFEALKGSHENIEIGNYVASILNLDLTEITKRLNGLTPQ